MKEMASKEKSLIVAAFDLQKVLSVPYGEHSDFFYKPKLAVYDLTITNLDTREVHCYVWDQTIAKRGTNETASCLNKFINGLPKKFFHLLIIVVEKNAIDSCHRTKNQD